MSTAIKPNDQPGVSVDRFLNVAAYKFVRLSSLRELQAELKGRCLELGLRGTILLSEEGINLFLAGEPATVDEFLCYLQAKESLSDLEVKRSYSDKLPFRRMLVRVKKEIIPCGMEQIDPACRTSPKLSAQELKQWLDEGRKVRLLDVRNKYEVELGTFVGAEQLDLGHFREFKDAIEHLPKAAKSEPLVMFCTGGIRCEKAGPLMEDEGFREVYQLDGGILKYFEECGGDHYDGSCFVFDGRVALDPELQPTGNLLCFACQAVLTAEDVTSGKFLFGEYCPQCYQPPEILQQAQFQQRQQTISEVARRQTGCTPYDHRREIHVPGRFAGLDLLSFLTQWQPRIGSEQWLEWITAERITRETSGIVCKPADLVREGECFVHLMPETVEPPINPAIELIYEDDSLVVVNKPAPLPCHPSGRFYHNTLLSILSDAYPKEKLRVAHRIDANTSGVVLLCRKYRPARIVQPQFTEQTVIKRYVARVTGHPDWNSIQCDLPITSAPQSGLGGRKTIPSPSTIDALTPDSTQVDDPAFLSKSERGLAAATEFRVLARFSDGTSLIEAIPKTGRTHQIRLHLEALGFPIQGDPLYNSTFSNLEGSDTPSAEAKASTLRVDEPSMCLHAWELSLRHPDSGEQVTFQAPWPEWASGGEED